MKESKVNYDTLVRTNLKDDSVSIPERETAKVGFTFLAPFFSGKGLNNRIMTISGPGSFDSTFGSDSDNTRKYGHGALIAREVLAGGGTVSGCRLMPENATKSGLILGTWVCGTIIPDQPQYKRNIYGNFVLDNAGDKVQRSEVPSEGEDPVAVTATAVDVAFGSIPYDFTKTEEVNMTPSSKTIEIKTVSKVWTFYPLVAIKNIGTGKCGNDVGVTIARSSERDGRRNDGRRYDLNVFETTPKGVQVGLGSNFEALTFSFNKDAVKIEGSDISDALDVAFEDYNKDYPLPIEIVYAYDNFDDLTELLGEYFTGDDEMIDVVSFRDVKGNPYDRIIEPTGDDAFTAAINIESSTQLLVGGTDGDIDPKIVLANAVIEFNALDDVEKVKDVVLPGGLVVSDVTGPSIIDAQVVVNNTRTQLLMDFFRGKIDDNLFDSRIINCGIALDAWFPTEVKKVMVGDFLSKVRDDVFVYLDLGPSCKDLSTAESIALDLSNSVGTPYGTVAINIHSGRTTNRSRNIRTTGNYEIASALTELYNFRGDYTVHAGYFSGRVRNMEFDFYPKIIEDNLQLQPLEDLNLLFARRLGEKKDAHFMSDDSMYNVDFSKLGSIRNLIFAGTVMRTLRKVLIRYSFHPNNALGAIDGATRELDKIFAGKHFNPELPISFKIFQTKNDKANETATVDLGISFPDTIKKWNSTIHAKRAEA